MADAEKEKLNLLREHRLSKEKFYYNLVVLSGGTISLLVTLINIQRDIVNNLANCSKNLLWWSIWFLIASLISAIFRNLLCSTSVEKIALKAELNTYDKVIKESAKENVWVKVFSISSLLLYIVGFIIFAVIFLSAIL